MGNTSASSKFALHLLLPLLFLFSSIHADSDEHQILLQIKQDLGNPTELSSWNTTSIANNHCNWSGIQCDKTTGSVIEISFSNMNFVEPLPTGICKLSNLTYLDLSYNYFPGNFPTHLYNCTHLQYLDLSQNYFVGPIPSDIYRLSGNLQFLDLGANNFSGNIPAGIGQLPSLQVLNLYQNRFNGSFPAEIGNLTNLIRLRLPFNPFIPARIPPEFGRLKNLQYLWMTQANLIGEIPETLGNLLELQHLDLADNNLTGKIPNGLFQLKKLKILLLFYNKLSGEIPGSIQALGLTGIDLSKNQLTGTIPENIGNLANLSYLFLYANKLSGKIPASIGRIPALTDIRLFRNRLTGPLPPDLGLHSKLKNLEVSENQLSGELPGNLCAGRVFRGLVVFSNNLTGVLPRSLGDCPSLTSVQVYKNGFSGDVPAGLWSSQNVTTLLMSDNLFSGVLPDKLAWNLSMLQIENNRFTGNFPTNISFSKNLRVIEASNNLFSGTIPVGITALTLLSNLLLDSNRISGEIPQVLISWESLNVLNLSNNNLIGKIPSAIGNLTNLNSLDISENQLTGNIPPEIGNLKMSFLNLSGNRLTGKIPADLESPANDRSFLDNPDLCAGNPILKLRSCNSEPGKKDKLATGFFTGILTIVGTVFITAVILALIFYRARRKHKCEKDYGSWKLTSFQRLDFTESNIITSLTENNLIGKGGFGEIYRVAIGNREGEIVAVKKLWNVKKFDEKTEREFEAEVEILGKIRHSNIVKLLCCISREDSKLLVYEYMENGSLDQWIGSGLDQERVLDWPTRLKIAVGAAQGLCYMHHSCSPSIIHRDVKSSNILLDSEFKARIADFGLARMLVKNGEPDTMSRVAGSFGYIAPEYGYTIRVSEKSDVYSFGVVLLELVTGRSANDGQGQANLVEWMWHHFKEDKPISDAFDKLINEPSFVDDMSMVLKLALICTNKLPSARPSMKEVMQILLRCEPHQSVHKHSREHDMAPLLHDRTIEREDNVVHGAHNV